MTFCIQILYTSDWENIAKLVVPNAFDYCIEHDYAWNVQQIESPYDGFEKLKYIQRIFKANEADVVMSLDCDTLITNHKIKIEDFIDDEHDFYICKDYNGINAGSFIVKNTEWGNAFLKALLVLKKYNDKMYCEQDVIDCYMALYPNDEKIKILPHPSINSYLYENYPDIPMQTHKQGQWEVGDFLLHLPGCSIEKRIEIFNKIKDQIIYE